MMQRRSLKIIGEYVLLFSIILVLSLLLIWRSGVPIIGIDDANIFFVYARNLAQGDGFVYNPGGERVEGFTSLLWLIIITPFFHFFRSPEKAIFLLSVAITSGTVAIIYRFIRYLLSDQLGLSDNIAAFYSLLSVAWCLGSPGFIVWSTVSLMDVGLWTFLNTCFLILYIKTVLEKNIQPWQTTVFCLITAAMILVRPETQLLLLILIPKLIIMLCKERVHLRLRFIAATLSTYIGITGLLCIFRIVYFGYPLPNTYYAKVSPSQLYNLGKGLHYFIGFMAWNSLTVIVLAAAATGILVCYSHRIRTRSTHCQDRLLEILGLVSLPALIGILHPLIGGGDHFDAYRFFQPFWPWFILPAILAAVYFQRNECPNVKQKGSSVCGSFLLMIITTFIIFSGADNWPRVLYKGILLLRSETNIALDGRKNGEALNVIVNHLHSKPSSVGIYTAGGFAFAYEGIVFDMLGLNDVEMAHTHGERKGRKNHAAFNEAVFWRRKPDIILPVICPKAYDEYNLLPHEHGSKVSNSNYFSGLMEKRRFREEYIPCFISVTEHPEACVYAYYRKEFITSNSTSPVTIIKVHDRGWK